jgi:hypothetical protein
MRLFAEIHRKRFLQIVIPATMMVLSGCSNSAGSPVRRKPGGGNWFARLATQRVGCCWKVGGSKSLFGQIEIPAFQKRQHPTFSFSSANRKLVPHKSYHRFLQICKFSENRNFRFSARSENSCIRGRLMGDSKFVGWLPFVPNCPTQTPMIYCIPERMGQTGQLTP